MLARLVSALRSRKDLIERLADGARGVHHMKSPHAGHYPNIVYSVVSNTPALHGDDMELQSSLTVRIHIVTRDGAYEGILYSVNCVMRAMGFMRVRTVETYDDDLKVLVTDYMIGVDS